MPTTATELTERLAAIMPKLEPCQYGHYPWDDWHRNAITNGLDKNLADLGRELMREAYNHCWDEVLLRLCGCQDNGRTMLATALRKPKQTQRLWQIILRTDGLRGDYHPRQHAWRHGFLRNDALRLVDQLVNTITP